MLSSVGLGAEADVEGARLDSALEIGDSSSERSAVGEGRMEAPRVNEGTDDCWVGLSSCRRSAACGAAATD